MPPGFHPERIEECDRVINSLTPVGGFDCDTPLLTPCISEKDRLTLGSIKKGSIKAMKNPAHFGTKPRPSVREKEKAVKRWTFEEVDRLVKVRSTPENGRAKGAGKRIHPKSQPSLSSMKDVAMKTETLRPAARKLPHPVSVLPPRKATVKQPLALSKGKDAHCGVQCLPSILYLSVTKVDCTYLNLATP